MLPNGGIFSLIGTKIEITNYQLKSGFTKLRGIWTLTIRFFNRIISDIFDVLRETTFTISDSMETILPVESEKVRVISLSTAEITEIKEKKSFFGVRIP